MTTCGSIPSFWNMYRIRGSSHALLLGIRPGSTITILSTKGRTCSENTHDCLQKFHTQPCSSCFWIAPCPVHKAWGCDQQEHLLPCFPKPLEASYSDQMAWKAEARCFSPAQNVRPHSTQATVETA